MSKRKNSTVWLNRGWFPVYIGFVPSERAWLRTMKKMGVKDAPYPQQTAGHCAYFVTNIEGTILISLNESDSKADPDQIIALLAHECQHALHFVFEHIGESKPSSELLAYGIQSLLQETIAAYEATRGPLVLKSRKKTKK